VGAALDGADPGRCYAAAWTLSQVARRRPDCVDDGVIARLDDEAPASLSPSARTP
jgi:hypothetical protein